MNSPFLQSISISNFRRMKGHWKLPLDAPIVLIHGPNGTGKTSVLSAIELALTGEVRSMLRQDDRYTAHLPHYGESFATLGIEVRDESDRTNPPGVMTVGGNEIKGSPALGAERAQFYAERSYLDQVSLGRLLELYQYTEGSQESSLARFVNELLGLDQLDSLRSGLIDATHLTKFRKLFESYPQLENKLKDAESRLETASSQLEEINAKLIELRAELLEVITNLGLELNPVEDDLDELFRQLADESSAESQIETKALVQVLAELGGRINALASQQAIMRLSEARALRGQLDDDYARWQSESEAPIAAIRSEVDALEIGAEGSFRERLDAEFGRLDALLNRQDTVQTEIDTIASRRLGLSLTLDEREAQVSEAATRAGTLASALAAIRDEISDDVCPVCDRDFAELADGHLLSHVGRKVDQITNQGRELALRSRERDEARVSVQETDRELRDLRAAILGDSEVAATLQRRRTVGDLRARLDALREAIDVGSALRQRTRRAATDVDDIQGYEDDLAAALAELADHATRVGARVAGPGESPRDTWTRVNESAIRRQEVLEDRQAAIDRALSLANQSRDSIDRATTLTSAVTEAAQEKRAIEQQIGEADRRRDVAKAVHAAASVTRTEIVQRVFTESLNDVWRDVFSRLAPSEPFVPAFGLPTATKTALELELETIHRSGGRGGTPSMMLSAGNLNTAALSLFIALHLAVEPLVPCLVFDDPVQSMDEVHIAQFAALLRVLSKQHQRQVIVAVHERELFEYLALELSPAFDGDELITIELGRTDRNEVATRVTWSPDDAIAV